MIFGGIDGGVEAAIITLAGSVLLEGFSMAWRLGRLEQRVSDIIDRLDRREYRSAPIVRGGSD